MMQVSTPTPTTADNSAPVVTVTRGEHRHPIPHGLGDMVSAELSSRGITGTYNLRMGPTVLGTSGMAKLKVTRVTARGTVELRCKPGGNDTARICWLSLPQGTDTPDAVKEADKLAATLRNEEAKPMPKGSGFTSNNSNVQAALKVLCASGAKDRWMPADRAKRELMGSGVGPANMTKAGWGQVLGAMSRRGVLDVQRKDEELVAVRVPMAHVPRDMGNGHVGNALHIAVPVQPRGAGHVLVARKPAQHAPTTIPMPSTVGREGMVAWLKQLAGIEEALLSALVAAENDEKLAHGEWVRAKGEADAVRESLAKAGQGVAAAKVLLGMVG